MRKMSKHEKYIEFIINEFQNGEVDKRTIFAKICEKMRIGSRTYDTVWKKAQQRHSERANLARQKKDEQYIEMASKVEIGAIIDKARRMAIASEIAEGKLTDGQGREPDFNARLKALDYLAKVEGDYAPIKNEHSGKDGQPIQHEHKFDPDAVKRLANELEDKL